MGTAELKDNVPTQPTRRGDLGDGGLGLVLQRLGLNTTRFVGYGFIVSQLS